MVVVRGSSNGKEGRVVQVYRKKWVIHVEHMEREKSNGATVPIPVHPSNVQIRKIKAMIARRSGKSVEEVQA